MSKGTQMILGATAIALLVGGYAATNLGELASFRYYSTLDEFRSAGEPDELARVHGYVADGTIERDVAAKQVRFHVRATPPHTGAEAGATLPVIYRSLEVPDMFKDGAEVVVEGRMDPSRQVFVADLVLAKCPSKFQAKPNATSARGGSGSGTRATAS
jgi:cytochrome c-type biogenesis protein CcmE